jgi:hypothetical protein
LSLNYKGKYNSVLKNTNFAITGEVLQTEEGRAHGEHTRTKGQQKGACMRSGNHSEHGSSRRKQERTSTNRGHAKSNKRE